MSNPYFAFKQFIVYHDLCAMKVGTDGVLLGAWAHTGKCRSVLDIGTGTGLIALMCAQRSDALIDAVEVDASAFNQATQNIAASPWKGRITLHHTSFQSFAVQALKQYELIISNPPYYRNALKPPDSQRTMARHNDRLTWESLLFHTQNLLDAEGSFCVIIPALEADHFIQLAYFNGLFPKKKTLVRPHSRKAPVRCMLQFSKSGWGSCQTDELIIKNDADEYSSSFREITRDYYLNF
jgi:tRNA1Val (adenine37-N6)-methyltransferase